MKGLPAFTCDKSCSTLLELPLCSKRLLVEEFLSTNDVASWHGSPHARLKVKLHICHIADLLRLYDEAPIPNISVVSGAA